MEPIPADDWPEARDTLDRSPAYHHTDKQPFTPTDQFKGLKRNSTAFTRNIHSSNDVLKSRHCPSTENPINILISHHTGMNLEFWDPQSVIIVSLLSLAVSLPLTHLPSPPPLSASVCPSLGFSVRLSLPILTRLIGCSPWAAVESPPAASDRRRPSCRSQTRLLLLPSLWQFGPQPAGEWALWGSQCFKWVCMCTWIRPVESNTTWGSVLL